MWAASPWPCAVSTRAYDPAAGSWSRPRPVDLPAGTEHATVVGEEPSDEWCAEHARAAARGGAELLARLNQTRLLPVGVFMSGARLPAAGDRVAPRGGRPAAGGKGGR
eukprot:gene39588-17532_t